MAMKNAELERRVKGIIQECWEEFIKKYELRSGNISEELISTINEKLAPLFALKKGIKAHAVLEARELLEDHPYETLCNIRFTHYKEGDGMTKGGTDVRAVRIGKLGDRNSIAITCQNCIKVHNELMEKEKQA